MKTGKKKDNSFKLIFHYLKEDKVKMILLVILMICNYIPDLCCPIFIGKALEFLLLKKYTLFVSQALMRKIILMTYVYLTQVITQQRG